MSKYEDFNEIRDTVDVDEIIKQANDMLDHVLSSYTPPFQQINKMRSWVAVCRHCKPIWRFELIESQDGVDWPVWEDGGGDCDECVDLLFINPDPDNFVELLETIEDWTEEEA